MVGERWTRDHSGTTEADRYYFTDHDREKKSNVQMRENSEGNRGSWKNYENERHGKDQIVKWQKKQARPRQTQMKRNMQQSKPPAGIHRESRSDLLEASDDTPNWMSRDR
jgi:hypothetical protein